MYPYIVADIGGTNARFATVSRKQNSLFTIENIQIFKGKDFTHFEDVVASYLDTLGNVKISHACAAIAGPIKNDHVKMTNIDWEFTGLGLAKSFGMKKFLLMNDFGAVAAATSQLTSEHLIPIKDGDILTDENKAVFGPGTGLGVAGVVHHLGQWLPLASEGGHVNLAPTDEFEAEVIKAALGQHKHVSAEVLISGPGLVNLYTAICAVNEQQPDSLEPAQITEYALNNSNLACKTTLELFCSLAGSIAGNLALTYNAKGGVYVAGGIFPRFVDFLKSSKFNTKFLAKGSMQHFVEPIPVYLISHPEIAFVGAAAWLEQNI